MELFHGSNIIVERPIIRDDLRALDFGAGFYLTSSRKQAESWARTVFKRRKGDGAYLNCYEYDISTALKNLNVLKFDGANGEWLEYVVANRKGLIASKNYDIVIGPVANDSTLPVIDNYMAGNYTKDIAIQLLKPQNLTDQYALRTDNALSYLRFAGGEKL